MSKPPITPPALSVAASGVWTFKSDSSTGKIVLECSDGRTRPLVPISEANEGLCRV
jgi:hypothetical protein